MDRELQNYYERAFSLFLQPGWNDLLEDLKTLRDPVSNLTTVADAQSLHNRQGQLQIIDWLLNRKEMFDAAWKQLTDAEEADSA